MEGNTVHFATLMDLHWKYKGRVTLRDDVVKEDADSNTVFTEQGSSASHVTVVNVLINILQFQGYARQVSRRNIGMVPSDHGGRFIITTKFNRHGSSSSITILKNHGTKSKIQWYQWKEMCMESIGRIAIYIIGKRRKESICMEVFLIHSEKGALSLSLCTWTIWRWEVKWIWNLCIFGVKHFALEEITPLFDTGMQTERQDLCLWYPQTHPKSFSEKKKYDLESMVCSYNMEEQNDSRDDVQRYVLIYQFRTYVNRNITSRQIAAILVKGSFIRERYDSSIYWTKKPLPEVILRDFLCKIRRSLLKPFLRSKRKRNRFVQLQHRERRKIFALVLIRYQIRLRAQSKILNRKTVVTNYA